MTRPKASLADKSSRRFVTKPGVSVVYCICLVEVFGLVPADVPLMNPQSQPKCTNERSQRAKHLDLPSVLDPRSPLPIPNISPAKTGIAQMTSPKLPQAHLITPSSAIPCHTRILKTRLTCFTSAKYPRSITFFSNSSPWYKATSSAFSRRREWVKRSSPSRVAECQYRGCACPQSTQTRTPYHPEGQEYVRPGSAKQKHDSPSCAAYAPKGGVIARTGRQVVSSFLRTEVGPHSRRPALTCTKIVNSTRPSAPTFRDSW
jgi:hypothetical protein